LSHHGQPGTEAPGWQTWQLMVIDELGAVERSLPPVPFPLELHPSTTAPSASALQSEIVFPVDTAAIFAFFGQARISGPGVCHLTTCEKSVL